MDRFEDISLFGNQKEQYIVCMMAPLLRGIS